MTEPRLPPPLPLEPIAEDGEAWSASLRVFVTHLVRYKLSPETTAAQLFALFDAPEHTPGLFYCVCCDLLLATNETDCAAAHIPLIAALVQLLKAEGLKRDGPDGGAAYRSYTFSTIRGLAESEYILAPPGYRQNSETYSRLEPDPDYVKDGSYLKNLAEYGRKREGMIRFWSLVGRLEADRILGEPGFSLFFNGGVMEAVEDLLKRGVWENLWAMVLRCHEELTFGEWDPDEARAYEYVARQIAGDERAPLEWRGRFAVLLQELEWER